jgi:NADPH:quinone reductase-like Zn-dependent oxidoreductase
MKAVVYEHYGAPEVLSLKELDKPVPKDDEILIRIRAAEATKGDCEMRSFRFQVKWFWLPMRIAFGITRPRKQVLGSYFAGEVESTGKDVTGFVPGDRVFGASRLRMGCYAQYVCLPASYTIVTKPQNLSFEEAAAVPLGGLNALHFMRRAVIQPGETVLVNGAGGSIGTFAVQIAKSMGAEVTAVDSGIKRETLLAIGADHFIDYREKDFAASGQSYDVIFNMVAKCAYSKCIDSLKPGGRCLLGNPRMSDMLRSVLTSRFTDKTVLFAFAAETREELQTLTQMIEQGAIRPAVDRVYPMEQAAEAHRRVETEQRLGVVVLSMETTEPLPL